MIDFLLQPWPWWLSGVLVGLTVPLLFFLSGKAFGISTSLQQIGAMCAPNSQACYLRDYDSREGLWTLVFALGIGIGGYAAAHWFSAQPVVFLPDSYFGMSGVVRLVVGGFLVGFGARYAGGCTSGHSITGIANFSWPSLVATIAFFAGGLAVTWGLGNIILD